MISKFSLYGLHYYYTKLSQFTYPTNTVKDISPEGGLNLTVCSSLHKTDWEAKPDQSVLIDHNYGLKSEKF